MNPLTVAYFTMEIALKKEIPTFAGGLGVLAADIMRSCADLSVPAACVTICWRHGYMEQTINMDGTQGYKDISWDPKQFMKRVPTTVTVKIEGHDVTIGAWQYDLQPDQHDKPDKPNKPQNLTTGRMPVLLPILFLDTNLDINSADDRAITNHLYGGDGAMRLKQELVLGIGGVRMLRALGYDDIGTFHINEGHAALLTLELLKEREWKNENVRPSCAFTTHTPVAAGHDVFDYDLAYRVCGDALPWHIKEIAGRDRLSMTELALNMSKCSFGVSRIHGEVSRQMFHRQDITAITNGIHHVEWCSREMQELFDEYIPGWRDDPALLGKCSRDIPDEDLWAAHTAAKERLMSEVNMHTVAPFNAEHLTIVSARRIVSYKRPELLYANLERLQEVCRGKVQIIHAGNAHPDDHFAQDVIQRMIKRSQHLKDFVRIVYLPNYDTELAKILTQGADIWLNTPMRLHEASGTSGMKACLNGTLNLSTLDGWWAEAFERDPEAGWRIGPLANAVEPEGHVKLDAEDIYTQLQYQVIPEYYYYKGRVRWIRRMKRSIGLIGYFNAHRAVKEYLGKTWISNKTLSDSA